MDSETTSTAVAADLRRVILRLGRRLRQMRDESVDLTPNQFSAMGVLLDGELSIGQLAQAERVQAPSMTRIVDGLQARGFVARTPHPTDRRQCVVTLTAAGHEVLQENRRRRTEWLAMRLAELSADEREVLRRAATILERMNAR